MPAPAPRGTANTTRRVGDDESPTRRIDASVVGIYGATCAGHQRRHATVPAFRDTRATCCPSCRDRSPRNVHTLVVADGVLPFDYDRQLLSDAWVEVRGTDDGARLTAELKREVSATHVLKGTDAVAVVARRFTPDPNLNLPPQVVRVTSAYSIGKPKLVIYWVPCLACWAVVHLSWPGTTETHPRWPSTELANNWMAVIEDVRDRGRT